MINSLAFALMLTAVSGPAGDTAGAAPPSSTDDMIRNLQEQVRLLQGEVDTLKSQNDDAWLTQQRASEIRGLVQDVLADADTRASLLQSGAVSGYDNGFFLGSADGNYLLRIIGQLQVRAVYNRQDDSPTDDNRFGFEVRRAKIEFKGHVFDPSWQYHVELDTSRSSGTVALGENGWIQKDMGNGLLLRFGQFKPYFTREEMISSKRLQGIERSQINTQFTAGTAQGVQAAYETDKWRLAGAFIDGANTLNTSWSNEDTEFAFTGRGEYIFSGDRKTFDDDNGWRSSEGGFMVAGGVMYSKQEYGTGSGLPPPDFNNAEGEALTFTADATWKANGWSVAGAAFYRMLDVDATDLDLDQTAFVLRGGYFFQDDLEIYAMYEWGDLDIDGVENLSVITVGVSKFFNKHNLKWQSDIGYGFNAVASAWAVDSAGWRADSGDNDGQIVIRSQFQLLF
jgi:hypothetical protein